MERNTIIGVSLVLTGVLLLVVFGALKAELDEQGAQMCAFVADSPDLDMAACPAHDSSSSWFVSLGFGLGFLIIGVGAYLLIPVGKSISKKRSSAPLDEEEQKVMQILSDSDGSVYQSDVVKQTDFSKVRVTRIVDRLETKDLVERKRRGMTNLIVRK